MGWLHKTRGEMRSQYHMVRRIDLSEPRFEATRTLLMACLPSRALQSLVDSGEVSREALSASGITDRTIGVMLEQHGTPLARILDDRMYECLEGMELDEKDDPWNYVDPGTRGERNPFLPPVRELLIKRGIPLTAPA